MSAQTSPFGQTPSVGEKISLHLADNLEIVMVWCPAGTFKMGSKEDDPYAQNQHSRAFEMPQRQITLNRGFWIGTTPITWRQWFVLMPHEIILDSLIDHPVTTSYYQDAVTFCGKLTQLWRKNDILPVEWQVSLPSEAQWEYACRAGTETIWYFGDDINLLDNHAWYGGNSLRQTHPVALKEPNPWGLFDVYGNVDEWCLDDFELYKRIVEETVDPIISIRDCGHWDKVVKGGNYGMSAKCCRSASRSHGVLDNPYNDPIGFRMVCTASR